MKRVLIYVSIGLLALASGAFIANLQAQLRPTANSAPAPTIPAPTVTPEVITVNAPTQVTVTIAISDSRVIPTGVNLLRLNSTGSPTNLGRMYDNGTTGDVVAADKIFTARITLNESEAGEVAFQVSAPFRGLIRRVTSNPTVLLVWTSFRSESLGYNVRFPPSLTATLTSTDVLEIASPTTGDTEFPGLWVYTYQNPGGLTAMEWWSQSQNYDPSNETYSSVTVAGLPALMVDVKLGIDETYVVVPHEFRLYMVLRIGIDTLTFQRFLDNLAFQ